MKALVPFKGRIRRIKRVLSPYSTNSVNDVGLLADALDIIKTLRVHGYAIDGADLLELGSGWLPLIPLLLRCAGAKSVILTDTIRLMDRKLLERAAEYVIANIQQVEDATGVGSNVIRARLAVALESGTTFDAALAKCGFRYLVPFRPEELASQSCDIILSRAVLEHVPERGLRQIMVEFRRIIRTTGAMYHFIDHSDHWEHHDKSISRINFLKYGNLTWKILSFPSGSYQNRLRRYQYIEIITASGFEIASERSSTQPATIEALKTLPLAKRFRDIPAEELAILTSTIVAKPKPQNLKTSDRSVMMIDK